MPKPVCMRCQIELTVERNGVPLIEMSGEPPRPYRIWAADSWRCQSCQLRILANYAQQPTAEHFQRDFTQQLGKAERNQPAYSYERMVSNENTR